MKVILFLASLLALGAGCSSSTELIRSVSPDGKAVATIRAKEKCGMWLPGPEPPRIKGKWVRLTLVVDGKRVYDSGYEDVGVYQPFPFAVDLAWAPDSEHLAYRSITAFRILSKAGQHQSFAAIQGNSLISSFKWTGHQELLMVTKEIDEPLGMYRYPQHYHGYLAKATKVRMVRVNLDSGITERFVQDVKNPTFMFHSVGFENQEISPTSRRVAFSDGEAVCVYDDSTGQLVIRVPVTGSIEGTWWDTDDRVILGIGLLSSGSPHFAALDIPRGLVEDQTSQLLPRWDYMWENVDWFRAAITKRSRRAPPRRSCSRARKTDTGRVARTH